MKENYEQPYEGEYVDTVATGSTEPPLPAPSGSAEWDATLVANVVANCRQQIERLRMKMPINVALALGRADEELADAQAWMRAESNIGTYENPRRPITL